MVFAADSWNGNASQTVQQPAPTLSAADDQFADPAIVLSSTDGTGSPPGGQPHWLKSIQQLTEIESSPIKQPSTTQPLYPMPSMYSRQPVTHSRMPFAQNVHMNQPGRLIVGGSCRFGQYQQQILVIVLDSFVLFIFYMISFFDFLCA